MFVRESTQKRVSGERITHLQLAESLWNPATQRADTRIVYSFGRAVMNRADTHTTTSMNAFS